MRSRSIQRWLSTASASLVLACGATNDGARGDDDEIEIAEEVDDVAQALGGWQTHYVSPSGETMFHVGPRYSLAGRTYTEVITTPTQWTFVYDVPEIIITESSAKPVITQIPLTLFPKVAYVASNTNNLVFFAINRRVYSYRRTSGAPDSWAVLAILGDTVTLERAFLNATHLYADTTTGIFSAAMYGSDLPLYAYPSNGENFSLIPGSANWTLLAVDPDYLYVSEPSTPGNVRIKQVTPQGTATTLAVSGADDVSWHASDGPYHYFTDSVVENGETTRRIRRYTKDTGAIVSVKSSATVRYTSVYASSSALYWRQVALSNGATTIVRRNSTNGNHVSASFPYSAAQFVGNTGGIFVQDGNGIDRGDL